MSKPPRHAKLDWPKVREIRRRKANGATFRELANEYQVSIGTITNIVYNMSWIETSPASQPREVKMPTEEELNAMMDRILAGTNKPD